MLTAWVIGLALGIVGSIPVAGPTTALVLSLGLNGRYRSAALVGLGSAIPESTWACLALWGFAALVERHNWIEPASQTISVVLLVGVGAMLLVNARRPAPSGSTNPAPETSAIRSLAAGLGLTGLNPTLIVNWAAAVALVYSLGLLEPAPRLAIPFGLGVGMGIMMWFLVVLRLIHLHRGRLSQSTRSIAMRIMGGLLLALGVLAAGRLIQRAAASW